ncbi:cdkn1a interacting zinc finger protein 1b isoform X2 [Trichomycterus rosablanca]|uniref:cdkn1a interacting zinc finger protein 1b isoform X2 n=1 Tax=Trichomycterus rosablanca TaxID=2290929 RepID=UPI002F35CBA3
MIRAQRKLHGPNPVPNLCMLSLPQRPRLMMMHPGTRMPNRQLGGPSAAHIVRPGSTSSLLGAYPAIAIPRMSGMSAGRVKRLPASGLPTGVRQSLLGPPPVGASLRNPHGGFVPGHQAHPRVTYVNKFVSSNTSQRKRDNGYLAVSKTNGLLSNIKSDTKTENMETAVAGNPASSSEQTEPPVKKQKNPGDGNLVEEPKDEDAEEKVDTNSFVLQKQDEEKVPSLKTDEDLEQSRTAEVHAVGTSLKVTIQQSSESRAFSTGTEETAAATGPSTDMEKSTNAGTFFCYICNITCPDQQEFQTHMMSLKHQQKLMEIHHLSNTCLAKLLPKTQQMLQGTQREKGQSMQRWCAICQCHFTCDIIKHRRTRMHKMAKASSRPFCTVCERHFRTPRKFVEHMKSPEHKQQVEELKEEGGPEMMEELITVDAIGCFEGEDDYEREENEDEEEDMESEQVIPEEQSDDKEYDPDTQYGTSFVVPVAGFFCKLCQKFYHYESRAQEMHCKSFTHYQNLQKYKASLNPAQENEADIASSSGEVANVDNVSDCAEEMKEECKEEQTSESQSDPITHPKTDQSASIPNPVVAGNHPASKKPSDSGSPAQRKSTRKYKKT